MYRFTVSFKNFRNHLKFRNVFPSYKALILFSALDIPFCPFVFTALHIFNKVWIFKYNGLDHHCQMCIWCKQIGTFYFIKETLAIVQYLQK